MNTFEDFYVALTNPMRGKDLSELDFVNIKETCVKQFAQQLVGNQSPGEAILEIDQLVALTGCTPAPDVLIHCQKDELGSHGNLSSDFYFPVSGPSLSNDKFFYKTSWERVGEPNLLDLTRSVDGKHIDLVPLVAILSHSPRHLQEHITRWKKIGNYNGNLGTFGVEGPCFGLRYGVRASNNDIRSNDFFSRLVNSGFHGWRGCDMFGNIEYVVLCDSGRRNPYCYSFKSECPIMK